MIINPFYAFFTGVRSIKLHKLCFVVIHVLVWLGFANTLGAQPLSGNFTINKNVPASSTNFTSFQALFTKLSGQGVNGAVSVSVVPGSGPYIEQVFAQPIPGASAANPISINANNEILRHTATSAADRHTIRFDGVSHIALRNLVVEALGNTYAWGIQFINNADNNTLENCTVKIPNCTSNNQADGNGIVVSGSNTNPRAGGAAAKNLAIRGCTILGSDTGAPWCGISLYPQVNGSTAAGIVISHNVIQNFRSIGVFLTQCRGVKVIGNVISRPLLTNVAETYGIRMVNGNQEDTLINNRIFDCYKAVKPNTNFSGFYGIYVENSTANIIVANNTIYENTHTSAWYGIYMSCSPTTKIVHNTVSADNATVASGSTIIGFVHGNSTCSNSTGSEFRNNIVSITQPGSGLRYAVYQNGNAITINNNNLYVAGTNAFAGWAGKDFATFSDWQKATAAGAPYDANSESVDPKFLNPGSGNLSPGAVELDNLGYPSGVTGDISNASRSSSAPDPGAYEFTIDANVSRITKPASSACEGDSDSVSVWIVNNSGLAISDFTVEYRIGSAGAVVDEIYNGIIQPGDSAKYTFGTLVNFQTGGSYTIYARLKGKTFKGPLTVMVSPTPKGFTLVKGAKFKGQFNTGDTLHPDIVAPLDTIGYELTASGNFSNADFGTKWGLLSIEIEEKAGKFKIAPTDTASQKPDSVRNGAIRFAANTTMPGDTLLVKVQPYSLLTGCAATLLWRSLVIVPKPKAFFTQTNVCEGSPMLFTNASTISHGGIKYKWYFGDNDSSTLVHPTKTYSFPGLYKVTLVAISDIGYTDSFTTTVTVYDAPDVNFSYTNRCMGTAINFTDASKVNYGTGQYTWDFGDGFGQSVMQNPSYLYTTPNIYIVKLTIADARGCTASATKPVTFSKKPIAAFSFPPLNCNQKNVPFTNNSLPSGQTGYLWDFGDGKQAASFHVEHTFDTAGVFNVRLTALNQFGCADTVIKTVTLLKSPGLSFIVSNQCAMQPVQFINTTDEPAGGVHYIWNFGDGDTASTANVTHTFSSIGTYAITLNASANNGCKATLKRDLTFYEQPVAYFSMPPLGCAENYVQMANGSVIGTGSLTYLWDFGNGDFSNAEVPVYSFKTPGTYKVQLTAFSGGGCGHTFSRQILIYDVPESDFTVESRKTGDGYMVFTPKVENGSGFYKWLYGDGQSSNTKQAHTYQYKTQALYTISLQVVNDGCAATTTKQLALNPLQVGQVVGKGINIYPNPTQGKGFVVFADGAGLLSAKLINIAGQTLVGNCLTRDAAEPNTYTFDFGQLAAGIYYMYMETTAGLVFEKITIGVE